MAARSRRAACTACFIFSSASCKRARTCSSMALTLASDFRPDPLAQACLNDVFRLVEVKDDDGDLVVHAQRCGRGVHDAQAAVEHFNIGDEIQLLRVRIHARVRVVDTVYAALGHEDDLGLDLRSPQRGGRVRGEIRVPGTGGKDHDPPLLQVPDGAPPDVGLGDLPHLDGGQYPGFDADLLQGILQGEGVDDRGQHPHVVGRRPVHSSQTPGRSPPDVAAAHNDRDLYAQLVDRADLAGDEVDHLKIKAETGAARQGLTAELEYDPAVNGFRCHGSVALLGLFLDRRRNSFPGRADATARPAGDGGSTAYGPPLRSGRQRRLQEKREPSRALSSFRLCRLPDALATFEAGETPDCDVFAKGCNFFLDYLLHRAVRILDEGLLQQADFLEELLEAALDDLVDDALGLAFIESRGPVDAPLLLQHRRRHVLTGHILGASRRHLHGQVASQLAELLRRGDEVRFAVDLDQHTDAAAGMDVGLNQALGRHASRLLGRCSQALLPQIGDGLLHIAAGLLQGPLAVHHAGLGSLPQLLDHLRRYLRHPYVLLPKSNLDKLFRFALRILLRLGLGLSPSLSLLPALLAFQDGVGDLAG